MAEGTSEKDMKDMLKILKGMTNKEAVSTAVIIISNLLVDYPDRSPEGWNKILCTIYTLATESAHEDIMKKAA